MRAWSLLAVLAIASCGPGEWSSTPDERGGTYPGPWRTADYHRDEHWHASWRAVVIVRASTLGELEYRISARLATASVMLYEGKMPDDRWDGFVREDGDTLVVGDRRCAMTSGVVGCR